ncbi:MAG: tetratricopeptide repeat protein [Leptolyngbya sp. SIOISBB]|nr:tetratricopeptide repeat protein [Leptolyngbya sp. SIOISBB]
MRLNLGDRVRTANDAQARIRCADLTTVWVLYSNLERGVASGCPQDLFSTRLRIGQQSDNAPGGSDSAIPYVMSPRRTAVLDAQPLLRWNAVPGVERYTVQVVGLNVNWETEVTGTEVQYAGSPLTPGLEYRVIVEADDGWSSQLDAGAETATFELLYPEDIENLQADIVKLAEAELSGEAQALALADIYIHEDLLADAVNILEPLVVSGTNTFEVYQVLGDIYRYIGLNLLAEERYEQAIAIASTNDVPEGIANAQAGLAEVKVMLDQPDAAIDLLTQAKNYYEALEDAERAEELEERLEELRSFSLITR